MQLLSRLLGRHGHHERSTQNPRASDAFLPAKDGEFGIEHRFHLLDKIATPPEPEPSKDTRISLPMRLMSPSKVRNRRKKGQNPARRSTAVLDSPLLRSFDAAIESLLAEHCPKDSVAVIPEIIIFPPPVPVPAHVPAIPNHSLLAPPSEFEVRQRRRKGQNPARRSTGVTPPLPSIETVLQEQGASESNTLPPAQTPAVHSNPFNKEKALPPLPMSEAGATQAGVLQRRKTKRLTSSSSNRIANGCVFCDVGLSHQACLVNILECLPPPPPRSGPLIRPFLARKPVREVVANVVVPKSARRSFYNFPAVCTAVLALVLLART